MSRIFLLKHAHAYRLDLHVYKDTGQDKMFVKDHCVPCRQMLEFLDSKVKHGTSLSTLTYALLRAKSCHSKISTCVSTKA